jgi:hypothetical protein
MLEFGSTLESSESVSNYNMMNRSIQQTTSTGCAQSKTLCDTSPASRRGQTNALHPYKHK